MLFRSQKDTMMRYFNVSSSEVQILTVTNQDERNHLSAFVPLEQIGTRTVSCSYVKPTTSGGIKVRTANLNWVTCNMIATTLSTSGVTNCEVVAACPGVIVIPVLVDDYFFAFCISLPSLYPAPPQIAIRANNASYDKVIIGKSLLSELRYNSPFM